MSSISPNERPSTRPQSGTARHGMRWPAIVAVAAVAVMLLPGGALSFSNAIASPAASAHGAPTTGTSTGGAMPPSPIGALQVQQAEESLEHGAGPAAGLRLTCSSGLDPTSATCNATRPAPAAPHLVAGTTVSPLTGFQWGALGVPSARAYEQDMMTYDAADNYVLLFGGSNSSGTYSAETWTYSGGVWTELQLANSPLGRDDGGLVYDPAFGEVLLFGGFAPSVGGWLNDTWTFSENSWQQVTPPSASPSPRANFAMSYDPQAVPYYGGVLLFGGYGFECPQLLCNDTWSWEGFWVQLHPTHAPLPRQFDSMRYDTADGYMLLFGGIANSTNCFGSDCGDTWEFNAGQWTQVKTGGVLCGIASEGKCSPTAAPGERGYYSMVYDVTDGYVLLFGGYNNTRGTLGDSWSYLAGTWKQLTPPSPEVNARWGAAIAFDGNPIDQYVLLFGGGSASSTPPSQIWTYRAGTWSIVQMGPPASFGGSMAYDPIDQYVVYFTGDTATGFVAQTWAYASGVWTDLFPATQPSGRYLAAMTWDGTSGYVLLFGGSNGGFFGDTWSFRAGAWTEVCPTGGPCGGTTPPSPRYGAEMAALPGYFGAVVLFGGDSSTGLENDTWGYFSGQWFNYTASTQSMTHGPAARDYFAMTYDAADSEIVLFGGEAAGSVIVGDTWTLSSLASPWIELGACGGPGQAACSTATFPPGSAEFSMTYDSTNGLVLLYGGFQTGFRIDDNSTWAFHAGVWSTCSNGHGCYGETFNYGYSPGFREGGSFVWDPLDGYGVWFGGYEFEGTGFGLVSDTWVYAPSFPSYSPNLLPSPDGEAGAPVTFFAGNVSGGGAGAVRVAWAGLPPDCLPSPGPAFSCTLTGSGFSYQYGSNQSYRYYEIEQILTDTDGDPGATSFAALLYVVPHLESAASVNQSVVDAGQSVTYSAYTAGGVAPLSYHWYGWPHCAVGPGNNQSFSCAVGASSIGYWSAYVVVTDFNLVDAVSAPTSLTIYPALNSTGVTVSRTALDAGETVSFGVDPSGGAGGNTYSWSNVPPACVANLPLVTCTVPASQVGTYTDPTVAITDAVGEQVTENYSGAVTVEDAPTATSVVVTNAADVQVSSSDEGQPLTVTLVENAPAGITSVNWSGLPTGCAPPNGTSVTFPCTPSGSGTFDIGATLTDGNLVSVASPLALVTVDPLPLAGSIATNTHALDAGQVLTLDVSPSGGSGGDQYAWSGIPSACIADSPELSCTVPATEVGSYPSPRVVVTDSVGSSSIASTSAIVVSADPTASAVSVTDAADAVVATVDAGETVTFSLSATLGAGGATVTWSNLPSPCAAPLPTSLAFACTPGTAGTYAISATVEDSNLASATAPAVLLTVNPAPTASPISVNTAALDVGGLLSLSVSPSAGTAPYTFLWSDVPGACAADLPVLSCLVPASEVGSYVHPTVVITDSTGASVTAVDAATTIVVSPDPTVALLSVRNASGPVETAGDVGQGIEIALGATDGSGGLTVSWTDLPTGCIASSPTSLTVSCTLAGPGVFGISAQVVDSNGVAANSPTVEFVVASALSSVTVAASATSLDVGQSVTWSADPPGGTAPLTYLWTGLPNGCTSSDVATIACAPLAAGHFTVTVTVTDAVGASTTGTATLTVAGALTTSVSLTSSLGTAPGFANFSALTNGGGTGTLSYTWWLNGSVDRSATGSTLDLARLQPGTYSVQVQVTDSVGETASSAITTFVVTPAPVAATPASTLPTSLEYVALGLLGLLVVLAAVALLRGRQRGGPKPPVSPAPPVVPAAATAPPKATAPAPGAPAGTPPNPSTEKFWSEDQP